MSRDYSRAFEVETKEEAVEMLDSTVGCLEVVSLALRNVSIDHGRAKEGMQDALDNVMWAISSVSAYLNQGRRET